MRAMPHEAGIHKRRVKMRGLPRRYSQAADGSELRAMPHGGWLERFRASNSESLQPISAARRSRVAAMRRMPQERRGRPIYGVVDAVLFMPCERFPEHCSAWRERTKPRELEILDDLRDMPRNEHVARRHV